MSRWIVVREVLLKFRSKDIEFAIKKGLIFKILIISALCIIIIVLLFIMTFDKLMQIQAESHSLWRDFFAQGVLLMMIAGSPLLLFKNRLFSLSIDLFIHLTKLVDDISTCHNWVLPLKYGIIDRFMIELQSYEAVAASLMSDSFSNNGLTPQLRVQVPLIHPKMLYVIEMREILLKQFQKLTL